MKVISFFVKRIIDLLGSGFGLILLSPIVLLSMVAIKLTMPGPFFFKQERVGKNKKPFYILKLRTMKVDKEAESNLDFSKDQERITKTGRILRRLKIDEIPQLINVLRGDMSLVGPRPTVLEQVEQYDEIQMGRLKMRPGMTGLAQVHGNILLPWEERIQYDLKYIEQYNVLLDIKILIKTVAVVFRGEDKYV